MPQQLVLGVAGVGLLGTIGGALRTALAGEADREAAVVAFLATASGVTLLGIGSAFWGLVAGVVTLLVTRARPGRPALTRGTAAGGGAEAEPGAAPVVAGRSGGEVAGR